MYNYKYGVIGKKWGKKIYNILKKKKKNCILIKLEYQNKTLSEYLKNIKYIIKKHKIDIIWLALPPINQFEICKTIIMGNANVIVEKPLILSKKEKDYLEVLSQKKSKKISVHFQYIFLKKLMNFNYKLKFNFIDLIFKHSHPKKKISSNLDLGSHLIAIKNFYFKKYKYKINTSFSSKDERKIIFKNDKRVVSIINFKLTKEKIIQKFVDYFENKVMKGLENKLSLDFAYNITNEINNL